ncbi:MAG TPA: hypothetical protein GX510_03410 [Firmicutes bacterium]|nr:hypothetical protein [Candidatus Fermentithermobacillaceae bacterium]
MRTSDVAKAKPMIMNDLEKALRLGYLSPGFSDFMDWLTGSLAAGSQSDAMIAAERLVT